MNLLELIRNWLQNLFNQKPRPDKLKYAWVNVPNLEEWLNKHPVIKNSIKWNGLSFSQWSNIRKRQLFDWYVSRYNNEPTNLPLIPENAYKNIDNELTRQYLFVGNAEDLYFAYIGHLLALEIKQILPWRLTDHSPQSLDILFDSMEYFEQVDDNLYKISSKKNAWSLMSPPDFAFDFIIHRLGGNIKETIVNLLEWCRRLNHFGGKFLAYNVEDQWQYRGFPPVSKIIEGTEWKNRDSVLRHRTAGCHGTVGFLRSVLRSVGIPVKVHFTHWSCGHAHPIFVSENLALSHGDDPYNKTFQKTGLSSEKLLINFDTFNKWFIEPEPAIKCENVGRQPRELAK